MGVGRSAGGLQRPGLAPEAEVLEESAHLFLVVQYRDEPEPAGAPGALQDVEAEAVLHERGQDASGRVRLSGSGRGGAARGLARWPRARRNPRSCSCAASGRARRGIDEAPRTTRPRVVPRCARPTRTSRRSAEVATGRRPAHGALGERLAEYEALLARSRTPAHGGGAGRARASRSTRIRSITSSPPSARARSMRSRAALTSPRAVSLSATRSCHIPGLARGCVRWR